MLQINVVKSKSRASTKILGLELRMFSIKFLLLAAFFHYVPVILLEESFKDKAKEVDSKISTLNGDKRKIEKKIKNNSHLKLELQAYEDKIIELKNKEEQVEKIIKQKTNPKKLLERIARTIPKNIWFSELTIEGDQKIKIVGQSTSFRSIGSFYTKVKQSSFFDKSLDLNMIKNKRIKYDGRDVRVENFEIVGKVSTFNPF